MPDNDDVILPDDYEATPAPEETAEQVEATSEVEDTKPTEEPAETVQEPQKLRIKYNHQEEEISLEEAVELAQKGRNYEKGIERAREEAAQQARDAWIAEQGYAWNGKPITTEAEYKQAKMEEDLIQQYQDRDMPPEVIQELVESRKFREEAKAERQARDAQAKKDAELTEFLSYFQQSNDRPFDSQKDTIPPEVWEANGKGVPLRFAYMEHMNSQLRSQLKVVKQNQENLKKAPVGSVTAHGSTEVAAEDDFLRGFNSI